MNNRKCKDAQTKTYRFRDVQALERLLKDVDEKDRNKEEYQLQAPNDQTLLALKTYLPKSQWDRYADNGVASKVPQLFIVWLQDRRLTVESPYKISFPNCSIIPPKPIPSLEETLDSVPRVQPDSLYSWFKLIYQAEITWWTAVLEAQSGVRDSLLRFAQRTQDAFAQLVTDEKLKFEKALSSDLIDASRNGQEEEKHRRTYLLERSDRRLRNAQNAFVAQEAQNNLLPQLIGFSQELEGIYSRYTQDTQEAERNIHEAFTRMSSRSTLDRNHIHQMEKLQEAIAKLDRFRSRYVQAIVSYARRADRDILRSLLQRSEESSTFF